MLDLLLHFFQVFGDLPFEDCELVVRRTPNPSFKYMLSNDPNEILTFQALGVGYLQGNKNGYWTLGINHFGSELAFKK